MKKISLHQFYFDSAARARNNHERYGQAMFNNLVVVRPDLSEQIRGSDKDPFYCTSPADPKIDAFVEFIEANWHKNPLPHVVSGNSEDLKQDAIMEAYLREDREKNWVRVEKVDLIPTCNPEKYNPSLDAPMKVYHKENPMRDFTDERVKNWESLAHEDGCYCQDCLSREE